MQEVHKVTIDLLFCVVLTFLTVYAGQSLNNEQSSEKLSADSAPITADNIQLNK